MCACLCPYSIPLFKYPHFRIVFLGPSMTLLFRDRPKSHFGLSETQVAPEISWLISFSLWGPQASHFAVRHLITCTCFDPEPQRIPAQSAVNGLNILRQERCRRLNMAIKKTHWPLLFVQDVIPKFRKNAYGNMVIPYYPPICLDTSYSHLVPMKMSPKCNRMVIHWLTIH